MAVMDLGYRAAGLKVHFLGYKVQGFGSGDYDFSA